MATPTAWLISNSTMTSTTYERFFRRVSSENEGSLPRFHPIVVSGDFDAAIGEGFPSNLA
jgi:hypothetical protein